MSININAKIKVKAVEARYSVEIYAEVTSTGYGCGEGDSLNPEFVGKKYIIHTDYHPRGHYAHVIRKAVEERTGVKVDSVFY